MYSGVTYLRGIVFGLLMLCFFYAPVSGASIPRGDLRLELSLMTGAIDTSGNNRPISLTGSAPTYTTDSAYGTPYAEFASGGLRVNTAWMVDGSNNFSFSFWMKLPETNLVNNGTGSTNLSRYC